MSFPTKLVMALAPVAAIAMAATPAEAGTKEDIAAVERHLSAAQSMTANFTQTDSKGRSLNGTIQLKRLAGDKKLWKRVSLQGLVVRKATKDGQPAGATVPYVYVKSLALPQIE